MAYYKPDLVRATIARLNAAPIMREDIQKQRRREVGAPMATRRNGGSSPQPQPSAPVAQPLNIEPFPDPLAALDWNHALDGAVTRLWDRLSVPLSFVAWSAFCFLLGWIL